jgi:hypothetical protein
MRFYTETHDTKDYQGRPCKAFALFLDTGSTGDPQKDTVNTAVELNPENDLTDPEQILNILLPSITQLVYAAYGEPAYRKYQSPLQSARDTGFDPSCVNGVKGCKLK